MKTFPLILIICSLLFYQAHSQELERKVIANSGDHYEAGDLSLDWTFGEIATETLDGNTPDLFVALGFHQGLIQLVSTTDLESGLQFEIFPNPTSELVYITSDAKELLNVTIVNVLGQTLSRQALTFPIEKAPVALDHLPAASYFLQVSDEKGQLVYIFQIQKINQ